MVHNKWLVIQDKTGGNQPFFKVTQYWRKEKHQPDTSLRPLMEEQNIGAEAVQTKIIILIYLEAWHLKTLNLEKILFRAKDLFWRITRKSLTDLIGNLS